jgi:2-phospho-L-lactate guanylyltransferase
VPPDRFTLVVPLKPLGAAKSRLRGAVPGVAHERLVLAIALDTVAAALSTATVGRVVVVTGDRGLAPTIAALGAECVPDAPAAGLNAALRHGARLAATEPVAALTADLPALRPAELAEALAAAALLPGQGYAADFAGTGTVLLTAPTGNALAPAFGPGSAAAHARSGATCASGDPPRRRRRPPAGRRVRWRHGARFDAVR